MLIHNFRTAVKEQGKYCPIKNELRVRKGRKIYRFACGETELRFAAPACAEVVIPISYDATVRELRRSISSMIDSHETRRGECSESF